MISPLEWIKLRTNNISLMWKINITGIFIIILFTIIIYILIIPFFEKEKLAERSGKLRAVVNSAVSLIDQYEKALRKAEWDPVPGMPRTEKDAKNEIISKIHEMRYDKTEFIFILDGDGNMVMHPTKPELEGKNMLEILDPEGVPLFRRMVMESQKKGDTIVQYRWESKYSPVITEPQMTYARYYWQWDWVVCTSLYIQDITDAMKFLRMQSALYSIFAAAVAMALLIILVNFSFSKPLRKLLSGISEIRRGNMDHRIDISSLDEIGFISNEFNSMVHNLNNSRLALLKSEKKYRDMTDLLPDLIFETDSDLRITYFNRSGFEITGYSAADMERGIHLKDLVEENDYRIFRGMFMDEKTERVFSKHKVIKKDGSSFYGENSISILRENGKPVLARGSIRDISEKQKFEEQIMQSQKMETIGILAGGLAHDFNNVLGGIISTVSLMKYEFENSTPFRPEDFKEYIDIMEQSGQRASDMVQQLLTLSRKKKTEFLPVNLSETVINVKKICDNTLDKSIAIKIELNNDKAFVRADATQMEQVLLNLCVNAGHAMTIMREEDEEPGGILIISLEMVHGDRTLCELYPHAEEKDYWMLTVSDNGVGMDSRTLSHIFVPFFTTKDKGAGTGLGLSMVYNIIRQHGGFINVYSDKGIGSTFNIYIPVYRGKHSGSDLSSEKHDFHGEGLILIIDDEELMRKVAMNILKKCGYDVLTAKDGEEGLKIFGLKHKDISAVLLDLAMPKISGDRVYDGLRAIDNDVKVILVSGFSQDGRVDTALGKGIDMFIQKPYTFEKLAEAFKNLLYPDEEDEI